jgi:cytochrome c556
VRVILIAGFSFLFLAVSAKTQPVGAGETQSAKLVEVQSERLWTMKTINNILLEVMVNVRRGNLPEVAKAAEKVTGLLAIIPSLSPEGSDIGETRIRPEVWKDFGHYKELTQNAVTAAKKLGETAASGDQASTMSAFVLLAGTCKKCHKPYRKKKNTED